MPNVLARLRDYVVTIALPCAIVAGSTWLGIIVGPWHHEGYAALMFVAGITVVGATSGLWIAVACATAGALSFNYFIAEPAGEFNFSEPKDLIPPTVFLVCSVTTALISGRARDQARAAQIAKAQLDDLLEVSRRFQQKSGAAAIRRLLAAEVDRLGPDCALFWQDEGGLVREAGAAGDLAMARAALGRLSAAEMPKGLSCHLVGDGVATPGVLMCDTRTSQRDGFATDHVVMIEGLGRLANLALARVRLADELAEQRARSRVEQLQSALLMSVSHDLRTPLTTIATSAETLRAFADAIVPVDRDALLLQIESECTRLNRLTDNLMQMTRLEAVDLSQTAGAIVVDDMLRHCLRLATPDAGGRRIEARLGCEGAVVRADTALFELAVGNVVQNAIKFSPDGSTITVASAIGDGECTIAISDQGIGVPAEEQARVFQRFHRATRPGQAIPGSGLGLAIARGFVEASEGSIALTSPGNDGEGTTVTIRLPLVMEDSAS